MKIQLGTTVWSHRQNKIYGLSKNTKKKLENEFGKLELSTVVYWCPYQMNWSIEKCNCYKNLNNE